MKSTINTPENAKLLGERIANYRKKADYTQEAVANELQIGSEQVSRIERGTSIPNALRLLELAELFDCPVEAFLTDSSIRLKDQTLYINKLISPLNNKDRQLIVQMIEQFVNRLKESQ